MPDEIQLPEALKGASQATVVEQTRAAAEVAAAVSVAKQFPRDMTRAVAQMRQACAQKSLADRAFYSLPRAGGRVEGSTVHLARELARCFGNIDFGIRELRRDDEAHESEVLAWAWDQENNSRQSRSFVVPHSRMKKGERQALTDLADIANNNNSVAARALRECILTLLPVWFRAEAEAIAAKTLAGKSGGKPVAAQAAEIIDAFGEQFGVTVSQLETRLSRDRSKWTVADIAALRVIGSELTRGEKDVAVEFPDEAIKVTELAEALASASFTGDPSQLTPEEAAEYEETQR
jgi:hypothetical protein